MHGRDRAFVYLMEDGDALRDKVVEFLGTAGAFDNDWKTLLESSIAATAALTAANPGQPFRLRIATPAGAVVSHVTLNGALLDFAMGWRGGRESRFRRRSSCKFRAGLI